MDFAPWFSEQNVYQLDGWDYLKEIKSLPLSHRHLQKRVLSNFQALRLEHLKYDLVPFC